MPSFKQSDLPPGLKKKVEQKLANIFRDICFNETNVLKAKSESDHISGEIREFILGYAESAQKINEVDLLLKAKEKGLELVETHDLIFFEENMDKDLKMRAFLIPGMKVDFTEENAHEKVTEDDLQSVDHELCVSFKSQETNEFIKLGNLLDIRATLARALNNKAADDKEVINLIKENDTFKFSIQNVLDSLKNVLRGKS